MAIRDTLLQARAELLEHWKKIDPAHYAEFEHVERALNAISPSAPVIDVDPEEFKGMILRDAMIVFLERVGSPMQVEVLVDAMEKGGVVVGKSEEDESETERIPRWKIKQSISWHVNNGFLTRSHGMIGLPKWGKERPTPDNSAPMPIKKKSDQKSMQ